MVSLRFLLYLGFDCALYINIGLLLKVHTVSFMTLMVMLLVLAQTFLAMMLFVTVMFFMDTSRSIFGGAVMILDFLMMFLFVMVV